MDFTTHLERAHDRICEDAIWTPAAGSPVAVRVDFRNGYLQYDVAVAQVGGTGPSAQVRKSQMSAVAEGDLLTVRGASYRVKQREPDASEVFLMLRLHGPIAAAGGILLEDGSGSVLAEDGSAIELET